jgi:hypothetical protein
MTLTSARSLKGANAAAKAGLSPGKPLGAQQGHPAGFEPLRERLHPRRRRAEKRMRPLEILLVRDRMKQVVVFGQSPAIGVEGFWIVDPEKAQPRPVKNEKPLQGGGAGLVHSDVQHQSGLGAHDAGQWLLVPAGTGIPGA